VNAAANPPGSDQWGITPAVSTPELRGGFWHQELRLCGRKGVQKDTEEYFAFSRDLARTDEPELGAGDSWVEEGAFTL